MFLKNYSKPVPGRIISGHQTEAAATKTVHILFEGRCGGFFELEVPYLPLKKDFSNIDDVMIKFHDEDYCRQTTGNACKLTTREFAWEKLIDRFYRQLISVL